LRAGRQRRQDAAGLGAFIARPPGAAVYLDNELLDQLIEQRRLLEVDGVT
jgi:hypothetical protein